MTLVKDFAPLPALRLDRHRTLQILVNLISNAKQALDGLTDRTPCMNCGRCMNTSALGFWN